MTFSPSKLWEQIDFPASGSKKDMIAWVINVQERSILRWQYLFVGQMIFWVTLFTTGKVWLNWFPGG